MYQLIASAKQLRQRLEETKQQQQQQQQAIATGQDFEPEYELEELKVFVEQLVQAIVQIRLEGYTNRTNLAEFLNQLQSFTNGIDQRLPPPLEQQSDIKYLNLLQEWLSVLFSDSAVRPGDESAVRPGDNTPLPPSHRR